MSTARVAPRDPLVAVIGTTGTGKSDLAVDLAVRFNGEIINADAMQMYRGLPVLTNQITAAEQRGIPHHLLAHIDPLEPTWTNRIFVSEARRLIKEIRSRGKMPIVVGGTLYYVHALLFEGGVIAKDNANGEMGAYRGLKESNADFPILDQPTDVILAKLRDVDPVMASRWHPDDRRKIKRSLEIFLTTGKRASDIYAEQARAKEESEKENGSWDTLFFWVHAEENVLKARLEKRVDKMVKSGLMDEVKELHRRLREAESREEVIDRTKGIWQSIGFKQMESYLEGELEGKPANELQKLRIAGLEETNIATRQYARYQRKWIKQKTLRAFREHTAMDHLYILDSTNADEFQADVLLPAAQICKTYLKGGEMRKPEEISDASRRVLAAYDTGETAKVFKVVTCQTCGVSLTTDEEFQKHVKGRKHRQALKAKKKTALVPVGEPFDVAREEAKNGENLADKLQSRQ
ncbi:tRNA isopentenyltransferase [Xylariaceae sp. FL1019]|nr:tRNA isopentenyltransferase [Xylariaceae sp. FL1019]